jgi:hypothetical protein
LKKRLCCVGKASVLGNKIKNAIIIIADVHNFSISILYKYDINYIFYIYNRIYYNMNIDERQVLF